MAANNYSGGEDFNAEEWVKQQEEWCEAFFLVGESFPDDIKEGDDLPEGEHYWNAGEISSIGKLFDSLSDAKHGAWQASLRDGYDADLWIVEARYQRKSGRKIFVKFAY